MQLSDYFNDINNALLSGITREDMRYSLIIPHYNDTVRLERLLRTVPVERCDLEVLVIDDCSPDQTKLQALKKRWPKPRWLSTKQNSGAGAARNVGLEQAQGERLVFADSDDEFLPDAFNLFDEYIGDDDELVYFLAEGVQEVDGSPSHRADHVNYLCNSYLLNPSAPALERLKYGHTVPWSKVYARKFVEKCRVTFSETQYGNDVAFNVLTAVQARRVSVIPKVVYRVLQRPGSLTTNPSPNIFLMRVAGKARLSSVLKGMGLKGMQASGCMLSSFSYGPRTVIKTWWLCLTSDMHIDVLRIFQFDRWKRFFVSQRVDKAEKKSAASSRIDL